jgi:hypothetical protein
MSSLVRLSFSANRVVSVSSFPVCPHLEYLGVFGNTDLLPEHASILFKRAPNLKSLDIGCTGVMGIYLQPPRTYSDETKDSFEGAKMQIISQFSTKLPQLKWLDGVYVRRHANPSIANPGSR